MYSLTYDSQLRALDTVRAVSREGDVIKLEARVRVGANSRLLSFTATELPTNHAKLTRWSEDVWRISGLRTELGVLSYTVINTPPEVPWRSM